MKRRLPILLTAFAVSTLLLPSVCAAPSFESYVYSYWGEAKKAPRPFAARAVRVTDSDGTGLSSPADLAVGPDGRVYIADTGNHRIVMLNADLGFAEAVATFASDQNKTDSFASPSGVFVSADGEVYVADTENARIAVFDADLRFRRIVPAPQSKLFDADFRYKPTAVAADRYGRMYVISLNNLSGIIALAPDGSFDGFLGVPKVAANPMELLWRKFMTEEQIERTRKFIPSEFSNLTVDGDGFVFATLDTVPPEYLYSEIAARSAAGTYAPVKKLNPSGTDVLTRNGFFPPAGDVEVKTDSTGRYETSLIADAAVCENGIYSLLDRRKNRIFTYDEEGNLLYVFGGTGAGEGRFRAAAALDYRGKDLLCLDKEAGTVTLFTPTEYGQKIYEAAELYRNKQFDAANEAWAELARYNHNLDIAYIGLGKSAYRRGDYAEAMRRFRECNDVRNWSKAFAAYRAEKVRAFFPLIPLVSVAAVWAAARLLRKIKEVNRRGDFQPGPKRLREKLAYAFYVLSHPFDAFYEIKFRKRGDPASATVLLGLATLAYVLYARCSGYVFSYRAEHEFRLLHACLTVLLPVPVWTLANWSLTCLSDGEGGLRDIYVSTCYALTPLIVILPVLTVLSHGMILEESVFFTIFSGLALGWTLGLVFVSDMVVHDFTLGKNVFMIVLSVAAMAVIAFLAVLFGALVQKMITFVVALATEISFRF